jgi:hypothetical protein
MALARVGCFNYKEIVGLPVVVPSLPLWGKAGWVMGRMICYELVCNHIRLVEMDLLVQKLFASLCE